MSSSPEPSSEETEESSGDYFPPNEDGTQFLALHNQEDPDIKYFQPFFWNGLRWKQCTNTSVDVKISERLPHKEITVISWNIWFGNRNRVNRIKALGKVITQHCPDFFFFQEIDADSMREISSSEWAKPYYISDPNAQKVQRYGNCMFSRYKINECAIKESRVSKMGRKMMLGTTIVQKSDQLTFGTFHLESDPPNRKERLDQVNDFLNATKHCPCVFLVGDTNLTSDDEKANKALLSRFKDTWAVLYPDEPGYTFDTTTNLMGREEYLKRGLVDHKSKRLDRLYYTPETITPVSMQLLGTEPLCGTEFTSDHYGILVKLVLH